MEQALRRFKPRSKSYVELVIILLFYASALVAAFLFPSLSKFYYLIFSVSLALFFLARSYPYYVCFVFSLWALSPLVRRLIDINVGWDANSIALIAPLAASSLSVFSLFKINSRNHAELQLPLMLLATGYLYMFTVGSINFGIVPAIYELGLWGVPLCFGISVAVHHDEAEAVKSAFGNFMLIFVIITSVYGIYQFISPQPWDVYWVINSNLRSIGLPQAFMIRVFSTMNSPGVFSLYLMVALIVTTSQPLRGKYLSVIIGVVVFMLTMVRSAWGGFFISYFLVAMGTSIRRVFQTVFILFLITSSIYLLSFIDPIGPMIQRRFETFQDISKDVSYRARMRQYEQFFDEMLSQPIGIGFGNSSRAGRLGDRTTITSFQNIDSGIANLFSIAGWPGTFFYLYGMILLIRAKSLRLRSFSDGGVTGAVIALLAQMIFSNVLTGPTAALLWFLIFLRLYPKYKSHELINLAPRVR